MPTIIGAAKPAERFLEHYVSCKFSCWCGDYHVRIRGSNNHRSDLPRVRRMSQKRYLDCREPAVVLGEALSASGIPSAGQGDRLPVNPTRDVVSLAIRNVKASA